MPCLGFGGSTFRHSRRLRCHQLLRGTPFNQRLTSSPPFAQGSDPRAPTPTLTSPPFRSKMALPVVQRFKHYWSGRAGSSLLHWSIQSHHRIRTQQFRRSRSVSGQTATACSLPQRQLTPLAQATIIANLPTARFQLRSALPPSSVKWGLLITESSAMMNYTVARLPSLARQSWPRVRSQLHLRQIHDEPAGTMASPHQRLERSYQDGQQPRRLWPTDRMSVTIQRHLCLRFAL